MAVVNILNKADNTEYVYAIDNRLKRALDSQVKENAVRKDEDFVFLIDGGERSGKSVFGQQVGLYLTAKQIGDKKEERYVGNLSLDRICMNAMEFKEAIQTAKKGEVIIYDEAYTGLSARGALTEINNILIGLMMEMGQKNLYVIVILPTFFMLEKYVALFRARGLFHIYRKHGHRGFWTYFNQQRKNTLYIKGKKFLSYAPPPFSNLKGRFSDKYCVSEDDYRKKKKDALEGSAKGTKTSERWKVQRDRLIYCIHKELGLNRSEIKQLIKNYDVFLGTTQIRDILVICDKLQQNRDYVENKQLTIRKNSFNKQERLKKEMDKIAEANNIKQNEFEEEEDDTLFEE